MGKWTRRAFIGAGLAAGGAFAVAVAIREGHRAPGLASMVSGEGESLVNVWVKLGEDNRITAIVPHSEMGQGVFTSMAQMLAEEMDADWNLVSFEQAPAHEAYANYPLGREYLMGGASVPGFVQDSLNGGFLKIAQAMSLQITGGSTSVRFTGQGGMRIAGAAARTMLIEAAAHTWKVAPAELRTEKSHIYHDASNRRAPFAEFAKTASQLSPPTQPKLKSVKDFKLMGTSLERFDIPSKVDGTAQFAIDVKRPGMLYAAVVGTPVFDAKVESVDSSAVKNMRGIKQVVEEEDFVAVVATSYWHAEQAVRKLKITWTKTGKESLSQAAIYEQFRGDMAKAVEEGARQVDIETGDVAAALKSASTRVEADYTVPYLAHAAMEPLNAVAEVKGDQVDIWIGHQNPLGVRDEIAGAFEIDKANITVHNCLLGGGFGRKALSDYPLMAVSIARQVQAPVKMIWSREQDTKRDFYRPATTAKVIAGLDDKGLPTSWDYQYVHKHDPAEASEIAYNIANQFIHYAETESPVRFGPWRSVDHTQHGFFVESFIDELAHKAGRDPLDYRVALLSGNDRFIGALNEVKKASGWGRSMPEGRGLGVAITDSFGTVVAQVVEVDVSGSKPRVLNVWAAADPGFVVNPDGFIAQIESGIIYGLSAALYGDITIENGAVAQSNFHDYPVIRMDDAPKIAVTLINSGAPLGGGGEPGTPPIAPALTNAIFAANGIRHRALPVA